MENIDPSVIQQYLDQYKPSADRDSFTPTINVFPQDFINFLSAILIGFLILSSIFLLAYIVGMVRKWKVQSAILDIHKDVKELKNSMKTERPAPTRVDNETPKFG